MQLQAGASDLEAFQEEEGRDAESSRPAGALSPLHFLPDLAIWACSPAHAGAGASAREGPLRVAGSLLDAPSSTRFEAAAVLVDVAGSVKAAQRLIQPARGADADPESLRRAARQGAEALSRALNACFSRAIQSARNHGGDVIRFLGDAILVLVYAEGPGGLAEACRAARRIAAEAAEGPAREEWGGEGGVEPPRSPRGATSASEDDTRSGRGLRLRVHVAVAAGDFYALRLGAGDGEAGGGGGAGGAAPRSELVVVGDALPRLAAGLALAGAGEPEPELPGTPKSFDDRAARSRSMRAILSPTLRSRQLQPASTAAAPAPAPAGARPKIHVSIPSGLQLHLRSGPQSGAEGSDAEGSPRSPARSASPSPGQSPSAGAGQSPRRPASWSARSSRSPSGRSASGRSASGGGLLLGPRRAVLARSSSSDLRLGSDHPLWSLLPDDVAGQLECAGRFLTELRIISCAFVRVDAFDMAAINVGAGNSREFPPEALASLHRAVSVVLDAAANTEARPAPPRAARRRSHLKLELELTLEPASLLEASRIFST
eukprot:tig00020746_g13674.t1